ncbi:MAG: phosphohistidine phosphatase SixA [Polyangiaceae bacterium]
MIVYVMRHGPAEDRSPSGRDFDRPLSFEGRLVVERAARRLRAARRERDGSSPIARILSSPLVRARETAEIARAHLGLQELDIALVEELAADEAPAMSLVAGLKDGEGDALMVGHQPAAEVLVRSLCQGAPGLRAMRTATIAAMEWTGRGWVLGAVIDAHAPAEDEAAR